METNDKAIDHIAQRSDLLRSQVGKPAIGPAIRTFLEACFSQSNDKYESTIKALVSFLRKGHTPEEVFFETMRSCSLRPDTILSRSLDSHFRYYNKRLTDEKEPACLDLALNRLRTASGAERLAVEDIIFFLCLNCELDGRDNVTAFPVVNDHVLYGWLMTCNSRFHARKDWPNISPDKGILQNISREVREKRIAAGHHGRYALLLESGLHMPRHLYLSDPVGQHFVRSSDDLVGICEKWRRLILDTWQNDNHEDEHTGSKEKPIVLRPQSSAEEHLMKDIVTLSDNLDGARLLKLPAESVKHSSRTQDIESVVWAALSDTVGWRTAFQLVRQLGGCWSVAPEIKGETPSQVRPPNLGGTDKEMTTALVEIAQDISAGSGQRIRTFSGGYFQGWCAGLAIPMTRYGGKSSVILALLTDHPDEWARAAARKLDRQIGYVIDNLDEFCEAPITACGSDDATSLAQISAAREEKNRSVLRMHIQDALDSSSSKHNLPISGNISVVGSVGVIVQSSGVSTITCHRSCEKTDEQTVLATDDKNSQRMDDFKPATPAEIEQAKKDIAALAPPDFAEIIKTQSPKMVPVLQKLKAILNCDTPILLTGETGSGKEVIAQAIATFRTGGNGEYLSYNCKGRSFDMIQGELFGHAKGAYTDAKTDRKGLFEEAEGKVLLLDEIDKSDVAFQSAMLRVLEQKEYARIGDATKKKQLKVRLIIAGNKVREKLASAAFQEDLFGRLEKFVIDLPPLRQRKEDISLLVSHFLKNTARVLSDECLRCLEAYDWPRNVRQLKNIAEGLDTLVDKAKQSITVEDLVAYYPQLFAHIHQNSSPGAPVSDEERNVYLRALHKAYAAKGKKRGAVQYAYTILDERFKPSTYKEFCRRKNEVLKINDNEWRDHRIPSNIA